MQKLAAAAAGLRVYGATLSGWAPGGLQWAWHLLVLDTRRCQGVRLLVQQVGGLRGSGGRGRRSAPVRRDLSAVARASVSLPCPPLPAENPHVASGLALCPRSRDVTQLRPPQGWHFWPLGA